MRPNQTKPVTTQLYFAHRDDTWEVPYGIEPDKGGGSKQMQQPGGQAA